MIPANLTHAEVGAFLAAVGRTMIRDDICAGAVLDGDSDDALITRMADYDIAPERAKELCDLELDEATNFVRLSKPSSVITSE